MKVSAISIEMEKEEGRKQSFLLYQASFGEWVVQGGVYPKHLKLMAMISDYLKEHGA